MKTKTHSKRRTRVHSSRRPLEEQVLSHPAWQGDLTMTEAADLLDGQTPYTFVLSSGFDRYHYILSYVSDSSIVKHKNIRIVEPQGFPFFLNGGSGGPCARIDDLIPACLKVSQQVCKPLA